MNNSRTNNASDNDNLRESLNRMKRKYPNSIISQSYLRLEQSISNTITAFKFGVLQNEGTVNSSERRLAITDRFVATSWGLFIQKAAATGTGSAAVATAAQRNVAQLRTFPNANVFGGINSAESYNLVAIYNGWLRAIIDKDVIIDAFDCDRFLRVPDSQRGENLSATAATAPVGYGSTGTFGLNANITFDAWYDTHFAFAKLTPMLVLNGAGSNEISLNLPEATDCSSALATQNFAVLKLRGFLVQNASSLNGR